MKKFYKTFVICLFISTSSCGLLVKNESENNEKDYYSVTFIFNDDHHQKDIINVKKGELVNNPMWLDGELNDDYTRAYSSFSYWYDEEDKREFNFDTPVNRDYVLSGIWKFDKEEYKNDLEDVGSMSVVMIKASFYNSFLFIPTETVIETGTGVCFEREKVDDKYKYKIITCAHVVENIYNYENEKYEVMLQNGSYYEAKCEISILSNYYDLAYISFTTKLINLYPVTMAKNVDEDLNGYISAIGVYEDKVNYAIGFGTTYSNVNVLGSNGDVYSYENILNSNLSLEPGFSGGPLYNDKLELIGINFAGKENSNSAAFPLSKVKTFLDSYC